MSSYHQTMVIPGHDRCTANGWYGLARAHGKKATKTFISSGNREGRTGKGLWYYAIGMTRKGAKCFGGKIPAFDRYRGVTQVELYAYDMKYDLTFDKWLGPALESTS